MPTTHPHFAPGDIIERAAERFVAELGYWNRYCLSNNLKYAVPACDALRHLINAVSHCDLGPYKD